MSGRVLEIEDTCGAFWAHCAYGCDLSCDHAELCGKHHPFIPHLHRRSRLARWLHRAANRIEWGR